MSLHVLTTTMLNHMYGTEEYFLYESLCKSMNSNLFFLFI